MLSRLKLSSTGSIHLMVPVLAILTIIGLAGYSIGSQNRHQPSLTDATAAATRKPTGKVSAQSKQQFAQATYDYWRQSDQGQPKLHKAVCKPSKARLLYYHGDSQPADSIQHNALAYTDGVKGAFAKDRYKNCVIHWNVDANKTTTLAARCETYVHEYGHLLGFEHNADPRNIMYAGYAREGISGDLANELWNASEKYAGKYTSCKSVTNAEKIL